MDVIPPGVSRTRDFTWALPGDVLRWKEGQGRYALQVQKQPGKKRHPLKVYVQLPRGSKLTAATPVPSAVTEGLVSFDLVLDRDLVVELHFGRGQ
jgi:hypothetical protein